MAWLKRWSLRLFILVIFVLALLAASDNSEAVALRFMDWETPQWPVSWWVLAAFVLGTLFGLLLNVVSNARLRMNIRSANQAISRHARDLDAARAGSDQD